MTTRSRIDAAVVPILSIEESRAMEARLFSKEAFSREALERIALHRAGRALASAIEEDFTEIAPWPVAPQILVLAGKGHNAGDALIAAGELLQRYPQAQWTLLWEGESSLYPLVKEVWDNLRPQVGGQISIHCLDEADEVFSHSYTLLIDGVFGMGFRPPLTDPWKQILTRIGQQRIAQVYVAVDLPSGFSATENVAPFAVDFSYLMGIPKLPLFSHRAVAYAGRIRYLDVGFWSSQEMAHYPDTRLSLLTPRILQPLLQPRVCSTDKRHYGRVGIVTGSLRYPGAALLTTSAALQAGAGLVTTVVPDRLLPALSAQAPEAIWIGGETTPEGSLSLESLRDILAASSQWDAMVIGPGLSASPETLCLVAELVRQFHGALVLDADVLRTELRQVCQKRGASAGPVIFLPHAGEWQRMQQGLVASDDPMRQWSEECGGVLVLKGPVTRLTDGVRHWLSSRGGPVLSRGGSGDMLAGITGALLGRWQHDYSVLEIAGMSVYWHGLAAEYCARQYGENAVRNRQLLDCLAPALRTRSKWKDEGEGYLFDSECHS